MSILTNVHKSAVYPMVACASTAIRQIADNIHRITAGQPPVNQVDFSRQY